MDRVTIKKKDEGKKENKRNRNRAFLVAESN